MITTFYQSHRFECNGDLRFGVQGLVLVTHFSSL